MIFIEVFRVFQRLFANFLEFISQNLQKTEIELFEILEISKMENQISPLPFLRQEENILSLFQKNAYDF